MNSIARKSTPSENFSPDPVLDQAIRDLQELERQAYQLSCVSRIGLVFQSQRCLLERIASGRRVRESEWIALATCALMVPNRGRENRRQPNVPPFFAGVGR